MKYFSLNQFDTNFLGKNHSKFIAKQKLLGLEKNIVSKEIEYDPANDTADELHQGNNGTSIF